MSKEEQADKLIEQLTKERDELKDENISRTNAILSLQKQLQTSESKTKELEESIIEIASYDLEYTGPPYYQDRELIRQHDCIGDWIKREDIIELLNKQ